MNKFVILNKFSKWKIQIERNLFVLLVRILSLHKLSLNSLGFFLGPSVNFENINKSSMLRQSAPLLGEHTRSILETELNYTSSQIEKLFQEKIIG